jgi:hypothetical protein
MATEWTNDDGLVVEFGVTGVNKTRPASTSVGGAIRELELEFDFSTAASVGFTTSRSDVAYIPDGAVILDTTLHVSTTFTGATTGLDVGTEDSAGSVIDVNGLLAGASEGVNANIVGDATIIGAGALIGTATTEANYITISPVAGTLTAGAGKLRVRYLAA